ncbi:MAG TPA: hypothetical protein DDY32_12790 [Desulfobulbaceae bacterium]|nr:hypothetical protein [Desulfobulbaceae bacterium]
MAKHTSYYCKTCQKNILFIQDSPNHALHIILSIFTAGLWLIVWFFVVIGEKDWHCSVCGSKPAGSGWGVAGEIYRNLQTNNQNSIIESREHKDCPKCAETVKLNALVCRYCGYEFEQEKDISAEYLSLAGQEGEAFCLGCRTVSPKKYLYHHGKTDSFYHQCCIPPK